MRVLIVGGTSFVGRTIAWAAFKAGHDVAVINRGRTVADFPDAVTRLVGDRTSNLSALASHSFDVTVDAIAFRPRDVEVLRDALDDRGGHYVQISSISAYQNPEHEGATEDELLLLTDGSLEPDAAVTPVSYGLLKAASERAAHEYFGDEITIVRPTFVIGSHGATLRFPYWVERIRRGGDVAIPEPRANALQYIDARDLGAFVLTLAANGTRGDFHAAGPYPGPTFVEVMDAVRTRVGPRGTNLIPVNLELVKSQRLETKFPLFSGAYCETVLRINPAKAIAAGLTLRDVAENVDDVVAWWSDREWPSWWLNADEEVTLLHASRS